ncbi:unnamed protein product [Microthlaspi erraticum]|uniref:Methionyl/Valyl/Leucyl/Isoleucyl-tRNA synthetase anticodon-binding domain-containing protein n=1 Tax=Microthlaspi erraticum TaxID=1685480 RepID=A0A6D2IYD4_9BRAS|nr:unnamed protein product [Microthlaspi erraticum]
MNIAIRLTEKAYENCLFREALKNGFYDLQAARDEYRLSCGSGGMNHDLILKFMDVQTRLIEPICPQFAEHVWRELLKKEGSVKQLSVPRRPKKGAQVTEEKMKGLVYVNEEFDGWKAHCLEILQRKFDQQTRTFAPDQRYLEN